MNSAARSAGSAPRDPELLRAIHQRYLRPVYAVTFAVLRDTDLAERATRETFVRAWAAADLSSDDPSLGRWLCTLAGQVAAELGGTDNGVVDGGGLVGPKPVAARVAAAPSAARASRIWAVREALDRLPRMDRELIRLQHEAGLSHAEIADLLDTPVSSVAGRSFRAHRRLDRLLRQLREVAAADHAAAPMRWFERSIQHDAQFRLVPESCG